MTLELQSILPAMTILALLLTIIIALALYRFCVARRQDFHLHVAAGEANKVAQQSIVAAQLNGIDRWGKTLTVVALVYLIILLLNRTSY